MTAKASFSLVELSIVLVKRFCEAAKQPWQSRASAHRPGSLRKRDAFARDSGFSLVELSIVLVILGLLTGGILTGQNLIRAAELRSVTTEFAQYQSAVMQFRERYFALPGDMANATNFWGAHTACPSNGSNSMTGIATCNGNGSGKLFYVTTGQEPGSVANENFTFWQHLVNAGLIEGQYSGVSGSTSAWNSFTTLHGVNVPSSRYPNAGWLVETRGNVEVSDTQWIEGNYGNLLRVGAQGNENRDPIFTPEEAWNIDTKLDDGLAGMGKIITLEANNSAPGAARLGCTVAADGSNVMSSSTEKRDDVKYNVSYNNVECALIFKNAF